MIATSHFFENSCDKIVRAIQEMEQWKGTILGGVDGQGIRDGWLLEPKTKHDFSSENLRANREQVSMDCSELVFMHNDLAAVNILVEEESELALISIVDFELAASLPNVWSRTKFDVCGAFNIDEPKEYADQTSYRKMMATTLGSLGYEEVYDDWLKRFKLAYGMA